MPKDLGYGLPKEKQKLIGPQMKALGQGFGVIPKVTARKRK